MFFLYSTDTTSVARATTADVTVAQTIAQARIIVFISVIVTLFIMQDAIIGMFVTTCRLSSSSERDVQK